MCYKTEEVKARMKTVIQESLNEVSNNLKLVHSSLIEANLHDDGSQRSECFELNAAFSEIADALTVFQTYANKL